MRKLFIGLVLSLFTLAAFGAEGVGARAWTNSASIYVDPLGSNANDGRSQSRAKLNLITTLASATAGQTVFLQAGVYDVGTNVINIPHGVSLVGAGSGSTFILSSCSFNTAPGGTYYNNCDIIPGNNSVISDFTLGCTTNGKYAAGIGTIYRTSGKSCTNVVMKNLVFTNFSSDVVYIEHTSRCSWAAYDCQFGNYSGPAHFDVIAHVTATTNSKFRYVNCSAYVDPNGVTVINPTAIGNAINHSAGLCTLENYHCIATNLGVAGGLYNQGPDHSLAMYGGNITLYLTNGGSVLNYSGPNTVDGNFTINGQSFNSGSGASSRQTPFTNPSDGSVLGYGPSNDQYGDFFVTPMDSVQHFSFSLFSLTVNTNTGIFLMHHTGVAQIDGSTLLTGAVTNSALTASSLTGTDANKKLVSLTLGNGLALSAGALSVSGNGGGLTNVNTLAGHTNQYIGTNFVLGAGANAGTGSAFTFSTNNATDRGFTLTVTTGNAVQGGAGSTVATIWFSSTNSVAPNVAMSPVNANAATLLTKSTCFITTTSNLVIQVGTTALTASTAYSWSVVLQGPN